MKRAVTAGLLAVAAMVVSAPGASATIHPIVESFDCANDQAFAHHPYSDPAEVPGQNPDVENHSEQSDLRAISVANDAAFSDFKLDGSCGAQPTP
jgi:hypothetical protein